MHVCPALSNLPKAIRRAACARSAERSMIAGDLPPSSGVTGGRSFARLPRTTLPNGRGSGEEQMIEGQRRKALGNRRPAFNYDNLLSVKTFFNCIVEAR